MNTTITNVALQQSFPRNCLKLCIFSIVFSDLLYHIMRYDAAHQYDIKAVQGRICTEIDAMIIRPLTVFEREAVKKFYLSLTPEDRRKRFCCTISDETISKYADRLNFTRDTVLGAFDAQAQLLGLAELVRGTTESEMAFSVRPEKRGQKIGTLLIQRLFQRARMCGISKVFVVFLSDNTPMRRMAMRAGMTVSTVDGESHAGRELPAATADELAHWYAEESLAHSRYFGTLGIVHWGRLVNLSDDTTPQLPEVLVPTD